jgi:polysaccharide biosynthesis transport protein
MTEDFEEQPAQRFDIGRYIALIHRRHMPFLVALLLGWLLVWGASWILPPRYTSSTLILVQPPTMPKNYVLPNVNDDLQARLENITQEILSRTRLLLIINKLNLYGDSNPALTQDEKVARIRKYTNVELVRDDGSTVSAFRVSYTARSPRIAQQVTSDLTDLFIGENQQEIERQSENTTNFIKERLADARASLNEQQAKLRQFQAAHEGELPSQEASNLQILAGLQSQLQNEQDALNTAKQQRVYFQSLINQYRTLSPQTSVSDTASLTADPTGLGAIDNQLAKLKSQLANLSTRYTDHYPAVQNLKTEIARTEKTRAELVADLKAKASSAKEQGSSKDANEVTDPIQSEPLAQFQSQLQSNQIEIANREQAIAGLTAKINAYQARLNAEPASEEQLADLTRGYSQSQENYDDLLKKENDSAMATSMEQLQQGERFTMLDPPALPLKPDFPNRLKFCGIGLAVGLALGVILAGGLEFLDDRLHSEKEIANLLPVAIIAEIPEIVSPLDERRNRRKLLLGWAMGALVVATILAGSALSYLHA